MPPDHWDIRLCIPDRETLQGSQAAQAPEEETQPATADLSWLTWRDPNRLLADLPSKVTATQMKGRLLDAEAAEETAAVTAEAFRFERPRFEQRERGLTPAQRGSAMHSVMQLIDLDRAADPESVSQEVQRLVQGGWLTEQQGAAVDPAQIAAFWASDMGWTARSAPNLRREFKFSVLMPASRYHPDAPESENMLLQGVVDCCFETLEGLTVIDFKTDQVSAGGLLERAELYRGQIELYSQALEQLTGRPVARKMLWFFAANQGVCL